MSFAMAFLLIWLNPPWWVWAAYGLHIAIMIGQVAFKIGQSV